MYSEIILIFSPIWWKCFSAFLMIMWTAVFFSLQMTPLMNKRFAIAIGIFIFLDAMILQFITYLDGHWTLAYSLPLQFCNIISFIAATALITRNQWCYELCLFIGILAPFQAIFTPAFAAQGHGYYFFQYFLSHGMAIFAPIFLTLAMKMRPRKNAWWKSILPFILILPPLYFLSSTLGGNYMFLIYPPPLPHALIVGKWPYYILFWILLFFLTSYLTHFGCSFLKDHPVSDAKEENRNKLDTH